MNEEYNSTLQETQTDEDYYDISSIYKLSDEEIVAIHEYCYLIQTIVSKDSITTEDLKHVAAILKYTAKVFNDTRAALSDKFVEIENQKTDLEHQLAFSQKDTHDWENTLLKIGDIILKRRVAKDTRTAIGVTATNINKSSNFVLGMFKRDYSPRSEKYSSGIKQTIPQQSVNQQPAQNHQTTMKLK